LALIGRTVHGNLRIKGLIGKGAMGLMLLVENVELPDRKYAVKVLRSPVTSTPKFQDRFSEEARNQAALDHPNIVRVHDYFQEAGRWTVNRCKK
jgi:serine/threonine protein kinase